MAKHALHSPRFKTLVIGLLLIPLAGCITSLNMFEQTRFEKYGTQLMMSGLINRHTPKQLTSILTENPELTEIVMMDVPGSVDDEANIEAARLVRQQGLNTRLLSNSEIASGGTDFFLAGVERRVAKGAKLGVHSWGAGFGLTGDKVPNDHPQHQLYLNYYREMGIPENFYWYTLKAAPVDDIHWMTADEITTYQMATNQN